VPLEGIAVVEAPPEALSGNAEALLREIAALLQQLIERGEGGCIDLQSLPLTPSDRSWLAERLGKGEVEIELEAAGRSTIRESGLPGVWWITHRGPGGRTQSEFIEVARIPDIVLPPPEDMRDGLERLRRRLSEEDNARENVS
jgi:hydrogenase-1 operon protein HyaF